MANGLSYVLSEVPPVYQNGGKFIYTSAKLFWGQFRVRYLAQGHLGALREVEIRLLVQQPRTPVSNRCFLKQE